MNVHLKLQHFKECHLISACAMKFKKDEWGRPKEAQMKKAVHNIITYALRYVVCTSLHVYSGPFLTFNFWENLVPIKLGKISMNFLLYSVFSLAHKNVHFDTCFSPMTPKTVQ